MDSKLKILCLHGYRQNAEKFYINTGAFRKLLRNYAEFHFLSAPHKIPITEIGEGEDQDQRAWWFSKPNSYSSRDETNMDKGLVESLVEIKKFVEKNGSFNGILGFSQGACLVGILCALKQKNESPVDFDFAIMFSGFKSKCTLHSKYYEDKINVNSLHVIGETDQIITTKMMYDLVDIFVNPTIIKHPDGHYVPGKSFLKNEYIDFLLAQKKIN